jgi:hypothetical protein
MKRLWFVLIIVVCGITTYVYAGQMGTYAFPQKGQSPEQQKTDENSCAQWAADQTGLNPAVLQYQQEEAMAGQQQAAATQQASQPSTGMRIAKTAMRGAALGGISNSMDDGAGKGAAMGAAIGVAKARDVKKEQQVAGVVDGANAKSDKVQADTQTYLRAYTACMEGNGYSIR